MASRTQSGYGKLGLGGRAGGWRHAHRITYRVFYNQWPAAFACHTCDNPGCCNPSHLYDGTAQQNSRDITDRNRWNRSDGWGRGERNGRAKLTEADVEAIRKAPGGYGAIKALAAHYGVHTETISAVVRRKTWAWERG